MNNKYNANKSLTDVELICLRRNNAFISLKSQDHITLQTNRNAMVDILKDDAEYLINRKQWVANH